MAVPSPALAGESYSHGVLKGAPSPPRLATKLQLTRPLGRDSVHCEGQGGGGVGRGETPLTCDLFLKSSFYLLQLLSCVKLTKNGPPDLMLSVGKNLLIVV